jgi:hypothetical protein
MNSDTVNQILPWVAAASTIAYAVSNRNNNLNEDLIAIATQGLSINRIIFKQIILS